MKLKGVVQAVEVTGDGTVRVMSSCDERDSDGLLIRAMRATVDVPEHMAKAYPVGRKVVITIAPTG